MKISTATKRRLRSGSMKLMSAKYEHSLTLTTRILRTPKGRVFSIDSRIGRARVSDSVLFAKLLGSREPVPEHLSGRLPARCVAAIDEPAWAEPAPGEHAREAVIASERLVPRAIARELELRIGLAARALVPRANRPFGVRRKADLRQH